MHLRSLEDRAKSLANEENEAVFADMSNSDPYVSESASDVLYLARMRPFPILSHESTIGTALCYLANAAHVIGISTEDDQLISVEKQDIFQILVDGLEASNIRMKDVREYWEDNNIIMIDVSKSLFDAFKYLDRTGETCVLISKHDNPYSVVMSSDINSCLFDERLMLTSIGDYLERQKPREVLFCNPSDSLESVLKSLLQNAAHCVYIQAHNDAVIQTFSITDFFHSILHSSDVYNEEDINSEFHPTTLIRRGSFHNIPRKSSGVARRSRPQSRSRKNSFDLQNDWKDPGKRSKSSSPRQGSFTETPRRNSLQRKGSFTRQSSLTRQQSASNSMRERRSFTREGTPPIEVMPMGSLLHTMAFETIVESPEETDAERVYE